LIKVDKKTLFFRGPCKLDFTALHKSNFAAYFTECQILGPEKAVKVNFRGQKVGVGSFDEPNKIIIKYIIVFIFLGAFAIV